MADRPQRQASASLGIGRTDCSKGLSSAPRAGRTSTQRAPLRTVDIKGPPPEGVVLDKPVTSAPTFVLVEEGREVGRITGYPGADFFWALLEDLIAKLDPAPASPSAPGQRSL